MGRSEAKDKLKKTYETPQVLATYSKEELAETLRPHGPVPSYGCGGGCGCGG